MTTQFISTASAAIDADRGRLARAITDRHYRLCPDLAERYGERGRARCLEDAEHHLAQLSQALAASAPSLFADYVAWAKVLLAGLDIPAEDLARNLEVLRDTLVEELPETAADLARDYVDAALARLPDVPTELPTVIDERAPYGALARCYLDALLAGDRHAASRLILDAADDGVRVEDLYTYVFEPSQLEVGRLWQTSRISVAQEHFCTASTQLVMSQLYPRIFAGERNGRRLVATCVTENLHEIGLRMVSDVFEMEGWQTFYLGANAPAPGVVRALAERRADLLLVSATVSSQLGAVAALVRAVRAEPACRDVKVLVGGPPFNAVPDLWRRVGADGWAPNPRDAVAVASALVAGLDPPEPSESTAPVDRSPVRAVDSAIYDELSRLNNDLATAQRDLESRNADLARLNEQKNHLLGVAAHDLRNPLQVILAFSDVLLLSKDAKEGGGLNQQQADVVKSIRSSSRFMVALIDDLLDVAKIEAGRLDLELRPVDLGALAERSVALSSVLAAAKQTTITLSCAADLPDVLGDEPKLVQVLDNLVGNAVKFSPPGSTVEVALERSGDGVVLAVRDQGPGIPADQFDRIFKPFERSLAKGTAGEPSTGLGLAIVKRIVEGHGGRIWVESRPGEGATFRVAFPPVG